MTACFFPFPFDDLYKGRIRVYLARARPQAAATSESRHGSENAIALGIRFAWDNRQSTFSNQNLSRPPHLHEAEIRLPIGNRSSQLDPSSHTSSIRPKVELRSYCLRQKTGHFDLRLWRLACVGVRCACRDADGRPALQNRCAARPSHAQHSRPGDNGLGPSRERTEIRHRADGSRVAAAPRSQDHGGARRRRPSRSHFPKTANPLPLSGRGSGGG